MPREKYHLPQKITFTQTDGTKNVFIRDKILGSGSFSIVYRVTHQNTNKIYAMKVISKKKYFKNKVALLDLENEIKIQKLVNHPNVVTSDFSFSDENYQYFALEYCPGGTVREYLHKNKYYRLDEPEIRKIIKDVIQGLVYIHGLRIIHHDIKLENLIIDSNGTVKIGDFGLSNFQKGEKDKKTTIFGTLKYLSPEMLHKGNRVESYKMDIWAVGISAFFLLTGRHPFEAKSKESIVRNIKNGKFEFPRNFSISKEVKDFIIAALQKDPERRPTAKELLDHPFLTKVDKETVCLYKKSNLPPLIKDKADNLKQESCQQPNERKEVGQKQGNGDSKPALCQPLNDSRPASQRQKNDNLRPALCPPLSDSKHISPRRPGANLKPALCLPISDSRPISQRQQNGNLKPSLCPPLNDSKPIPQRQQNVNSKPVLCPSLSGSKQISPRRPTANLKPSLCPPLSDVKPVLPRQQNANLKPSLCPPLSNRNPILPRLQGANPNRANFPPRDDVSYSVFAYNRSQVGSKNFVIPSYFVSRFCFYNDDLSYLLFDGTVGFCFKDESRLVMDPNERFAQFYKDPNTEYPDIIYLCNMDEKNQPESIALMKKAAKNFKKIRFSFDLANKGHDPGVILHNVNCFVKKDDSILFKLDRMNFQVNFNDRVKLVIFWTTKKLCFFKSFREKCTLMDFKNVTSLNSDSDELKKFKQAKILLSDMSLTIC